MSYRELYVTGCNLATALIDLGVRRREHIGMISDNRLEWVMANYGIQLCGAADVPRGTDITEEEIVYILTHGDVLIAFIENNGVLARTERVRNRLPDTLQLIVMDRDTPAPSDGYHLYDLIEKGAALRAEGDRRAEERMESVQPEDLFTIIYTSGTTGVPKGVQLTHANMISQTKYVPWEIKNTDRMLSILPIWHSYERVVEMIAISRGACTYYTNIRYIGDDLKSVRPSVMASAPRLWENIYNRIRKNVDALSPVRRKMFDLAYFCSRMVQGSWFFLTGRQIDLKGRSTLKNALLGCGHAVRALIFILPYLLLDRIVLKKLRNVVGGAFRGTVSGGGALPPYVDAFFNYIGIPVLEGYGMTETTPVTAVRTNRKLIIGTVGPPCLKTEFRVIDLETGETLYPDPNRPGGGRGLKGELHVRGPQVMKGYYKAPEETARVLRDGWMNTGDIGMITFNDCVKILGRSKETIVLLSGENVEPIPIEDKLKESAMIHHCIVVGNDEKHLSALVIPALDYFQANGHADVNTLADLNRIPQVHDEIVQEVKKRISAPNGFKPYERVIGVKLLDRDFEVGDEMTNTYKLKRHVITEKYKAEIAALYEREHVQ